MQNVDMEELAERAVELLGKPVSGSHFRQFVEEYCPLKRPVWHQLSVGLVRFCIPELGLSIWSDPDEIIWVFFHVIPYKFENDFETGTYTFQLPLQASAGDRRPDVHKKLGAPETSMRIDASSISESYYLGYTAFDFSYELPSENITEVRVGLISKAP